MNDFSIWQLIQFVAIVTFTVLFVKWFINDFLGLVFYGFIDFIKNLLGRNGG